MAAPSHSGRPYRIDKAPGKGLGLFATRFIPIGDLILSEAPLIIVPIQDSVHNIKQELDKLDRADRAKFYDLYDCFHPHNPTPNTTFLTNAFPLGTGPSPPANGIFPICSRINHSCQPNIHHVYNPCTLREEVYAQRDILAGEELVTTYVSTLRCRAPRQVLLNVHRFTCKCTACTGPLDLASDKRRDGQHFLDGLLMTIRAHDPIVALRYAKERLRSMEEEGLHILSERSRTHNDAAMTCLGGSDFLQAKRHAGMDYAYRLLCAGPENAETPAALRVYTAPDRQQAAGKLGTWVIPIICDGCGKEGITKDMEVECQDCHCAIYCSTRCQEGHSVHHIPACDVLTGKRWTVGYEGILKHGWDCWREI